MEQEIPMYADPQTVTVNAVAKSMPRQGSTTPDRLGTFATSDGLFQFDVRQNKTANRFRREVRLTQKKVAADPLTAVNKEVSTSIILVVDEPRWGFTDTELGYLTAALITWFDSTARDKLLGGEL
jgi:predicted transglutaminase-like cysteine proteinase